MSFDLTGLYFRKQLLHAETKKVDPEDVAASVCGINAQRGETIYLSFWNRMHNFRKEDLDHQLYQTRKLVKIYCMRGTVHIIPSDQFALYAEGTTPHRLWEPSDISPHFCQIVADALEEPLTKSEIADRISGKVNFKGRELRTKVGRAVRVLGYRGRVVFAHAVGKGFHIREYTFARAEDWLPHFDVMTEEDARSQLLANYLKCYGPAAVQDFAYWAGFKVGEARTVFDSIDTEEVKIGGRKYYVTPGDTQDVDISTDTKTEVDTGQDTQTTVVLLPHYDSYVMGHKYKSRILKDEYKPHVFLPFAEVAATIVKNGCIIGTWSMKKVRNTLQFLITPFEPLEEYDSQLILKRLKEMSSLMQMKYTADTFSTL